MQVAASLLAMPSTDMHFRLSIWRPASLNRTYIYPSPSASNPNSFSPLEESDALEQIYFWNAGSHDFLGAAPPEVSERIRSILLHPFSFERAPSERTVNRFYDAVSLLIGDSSIDSSDYWVDSQESISVHLEDDLNLRANITRALLLHLQWIARTFRHVPKASVLIR